jgi:glycolate dehydrogenase FAD-binding subunit
VTTTLQPESAAAVAAALKRASDARQSIVIRGAGTKDDWGRPPGPVDVVLDTGRLNRILAHEQGDMTATIEAGASLADVNRALAIHGQMLPLDPPFADRATIGGLLATNDSGPLRHRYGTPRDLVIGIQLATTDGLVTKAGGQVVKNVAGYDLSKLITGSFGSLAAIVSATFKLAPIAPASKTLRITAADAAAVGDIVQTMMASQLEPVAFEIVTGTQPAQHPQREETWASAASVAFLVRFASLPDVVDAQIAQAAAALTSRATNIEVFDGDAERALWAAHATGIWSRPGAVVRASWLPANAIGVMAGLGACATTARASTADIVQASSPANRPGVAQGFDPAFIGRAAIGAGLIHLEGNTAAQASAIGQLRASTVFGNVVIARGSAELKAQVDVWGSHGDRQPLFDALKRAFDPNRVLNAGRGPL